METYNIKELTEAYTASVFNLGISPEYNTGEVSLASLYRQIGWQTYEQEKQSRYGEARVNIECKLLFEKILKNKDNFLIHNDDFSEILNGALSSPKMEKQANSKYPILYPLLPDTALYSNASRIKGKHPWNPGNLIEKVIVFGSDENELEDLWNQLFMSLSCMPENENEDILCRILSKKFEEFRPDDVRWQINKISYGKAVFDLEVLNNSPARQFTRDLSKIVKLKSKLTRRQWLSILESSIRIGCASHIIWVTKINTILWDYLKSCILEKRIDKDQLLLNFNTQNFNFWNLEERIVPVIKSNIQSYIRSQIAINYLIKHFKTKFNYDCDFSNMKGIVEFGDKIIEKIKSKHISLSILGEINELIESDPKYTACKSGIPNNIIEFIRYSLGQKQTAEPQKRNFDQAYWLRKKGNYSSAPWIFDLGPASILTMVYCCSFGHDQYRTISDLLGHLKFYGISTQRDLEKGTLLKTLTAMQIVTDSPDAEGGMVIHNPFETIK